MTNASPCHLIAVTFGCLLALGVGMARADTAVTQTIVMVRHGEKPEAGLGQLSCQGLNRSLALPAVIRRMFGKPDFMFAPDPGETKSDGGKAYNYVRPLATIEPTAIAFGMPVDTSFGVSHIEDLRARLEAPAYRAAVVVVAWEHVELVKLAKDLVTDAKGRASVVPKWSGSDFDGVYVIKITRGDGAPAVTFERLTEGLDGQSTSCPGAG